MQYSGLTSFSGLTVKKLLESTATGKPLYTGGYVVLTSASLGLALILMSLELSKNKTREKEKKDSLKLHISKLKELQNKIQEAGARDLESFDKIRGNQTEIKHKLKDPDFFGLFTDTILSPLNASEVITNTVSVVQESVRLCKRTFHSDLLAGLTILCSTFESLMFLTESNVTYLEAIHRAPFHALIYEKQKRWKSLIQLLNSEFRDNTNFQGLLVSRERLAL